MAMDQDRRHCRPFHLVESRATAMRPCRHYHCHPYPKAKGGSAPRVEKVEGRPYRQSQGTTSLQGTILIQRMTGLQKTNFLQRRRL